MEKNKVTLEGQKLKHIADKNDTAQVIMFNLADRKRYRPITDINHLRNLMIRAGEKINPDDYKKTWEELQDIGVGVIVYGRNGKSTRFKWNYNLKSVGEAAMSGKDIEAEQIRNIRSKPDVIKKINKTIKDAKVIQMPKPAQRDTKPKSSGHTNTVCILVRPDFAMDLKLPNDITKTELDFICQSLKRFG